MDFSAIPQELRSLRQWTVWRRQLTMVANGGERYAKPPYRADAPGYEASTSDPSTWCGFDQAVACVVANASAVDGVGFMLRADDEYVVFDVDDVAKCQPHMLEARNQLIAQLMGLGTYAERSPSGTGLHVWVRARVGFAGRHLGGAAGKIGVEVYAKQFITCTGRAVSPPGTRIVDAQWFIEGLGLAERRPQVVLMDDPSRPCGLDDGQVLRAAYEYVSWFGDRWEGRDGADPGQWSHTFVAVLGVLDRVTGSVEQVRRLVEGSPLVQRSGPSPSGEGRLGKCRRTFADVMARVRAGNRYASGFTDHGRMVYQAICAERERLAIELAERVRKADEALGRTSKTAYTLLKSFDAELPAGQHKVLTRPPGVTGAFVLACERNRYAPYTKFAVPATLAALSGVVGRGYKTASGGGTNVNFILAAPSATGKTESMKAWFTFMQQALEGLPHTVAGPPRSRILSNGTASIQGIIKDFEELPSCAWFIAECSSQLSAMSSGKTPVEAALRDSYNELYDCAEHGYYFTVPRSVAGKTAGVNPVCNLSVSTFWSTTTSKFDVFTDDALDGFLSRVVVIRHQGPAGSLQRESQPLPPDLLQVLRDRLAEAQALDGEYRGSLAAGAARCRRVDQSAVSELDWRLVQRCEDVKNAALRGELPPTYTAASRLPQTAMRIAAVMAAMENPYAPQVTEEQLRWSFGYLLQNLVSLLSDMDAGELGHVAGDEEAAVVRAWRALSKRPEYRGLPGVPRNALFQALKADKVFAQSRLGRSKAVSSILAHMASEGSIDEVSPATGQRGRPTKYIVPVADHPLWS